MRYFESRKARIEIIPMIDIMLFLLVFFAIVTLHMITASGIGARLPQSRTAAAIPHPDVVIALAADGSISVQGKLMTLAELTARLKRSDPQKTTVTIAGASQVSLQSLINVMDACRRAGITQLGIAATRTPHQAVNGA
ncbi:MAG TPA: biopolymer transporter ExbD [Nitrococcus sp.]|nr:biopolymer transporter ExbD [Nitrococcus sp.]